MNRYTESAEITEINCEVLVIGSGAGGSIISNVLTNAGFDVLMVESGRGIDSAYDNQRPDEAIKKLWKNSGLTATLGTPPISYAEGECVGGGTEINSAIFQTTPDKLIEEWKKKYKIKDFTPQIMKNYYKKIAKLLNASLTPKPLGVASELLRSAGEIMKWEVTELERSQKVCVGTNACSTGCPTGAKQTMSTTILPFALKKGLRLISNCAVKKLLYTNNKAQCVLAAKKHSGGLSKYKIKSKYIFLCAGAINTPFLLKKSGIKTGAPFKLMLHPTIKLLCEFDFEVNAHLSRLPLYAITEFMPDIRMGGSLFTPGFFGMSVAEDWKHRSHLLPKLKNCAIYYAMVRGKGKGNILNIPFIKDPIVTYKLADEDWENLNFGISQLAKSMIKVGAKAVYPSISNHAGWKTTKECNEFKYLGLPKKRSNLMTIHLFSSCPPGENEDLCVTDSFGKVRNMQNLYIADASQIPEAPGVNPQATIMAMAWRIADKFITNHTPKRI